ncbi:MAG: ABC transporter ATP-binding protein [Chitinophagaceae bacterium]
MTILSLKDIHKSYGSIKALNGVGFDVPQGSVFGILGPNGSGKTTLLSIILDVLHADKGAYSWFGETPSPEQRKKIGSLLETPNFYHYLSAERNLRITHSISGRGDAAGIESVLKKVNLHERRKYKFSSYSLGMKQRLAIAASLLGDPSVLVLDEPTNGLDPVGIAEIRDLIRELNQKGHTILMASHLLDEVEKICTHVAILKKGNLIAHGEVDAVLTDEDQVEIGASDNSTLEAVIKQYPGLLHAKTEGNTMLLGLPKGTASLEHLNRFCFERNIVLNHLVLKKKRLEARFFELTQ